ncbi:MAG: radical SAM family heme chaperone HemW [Selenomonadaceae bacterium]|nr:radical SAM family heme chaperone HemW [Selenomonadaceae bacterium]
MLTDNYALIYVHIPFCAAKCNYCAFNSKISTAEERESYVDALITEIKSTPYPLPPTYSIYFGGGTPTILTLNQLKKIFAAIQTTFNVEKNSEITIEANPGTVDKNFLRGLREIGFNRLSLGVQSFNDELLKILGRIHNSTTALETVHTAKNFFDNISVDLMYGLPNQTLDDVKVDVETAAALDVQHISIYGLEVEPNTKFFQLNEVGRLNLPTENICADMYEFIIATLPKLGYNRYEVSNFAKVGRESRHNSGYWTGAKYFGFGAGAHSYNGKIRTSNVANVADYVKNIRAGRDVSQVEELVTKSAAMEEFCFLGLRMTAGIDAKIFYERFGENIFDVYGKVIEKNFKLGLLQVDGDKIFLTPRGFEVSNVVLADFLFD